MDILGLSEAIGTFNIMITVILSEAISILILRYPGPIRGISILILRYPGPIRGISILILNFCQPIHHERPIGYFLPYKVTPTKLIYSLFCGEKIQKNHSTWVKIWQKIQVKNVRLYVQNDNSYIDNTKLIFTRSRSNFSHLYGSFSLNPNGIFYLYICS